VLEGYARQGAAALPQAHEAFDAGGGLVDEKRRATVAEMLARLAS
jgi:hypothetical protein